MALICASVSSVSGLASLMYTARPSTATGNSSTSLPRLAFTSAFSASFIGRDASQISVVPLMRAAIPVPEPPPVTWMVKPGFLLMKTSAQRWPRMTMVSEPFTVMLRPSAIKATAPVTNSAAVPRANFEILLIFFPPSYSCSSMNPNCFSSVTTAERLELVDDVELQALQDWLGRSRSVPVERAPEETGEAQLDILVCLIEHFDAVLANIAVLPQVAEVERAHDGFTFDEHAGVGKLDVFDLRKPADAAFEPVAAALTREAGGATCHGGDRCCRGRGSRSRQTANVGAGSGVLDVVAKNHKRKPGIGGLDIKTGARIQQSELRCELCGCDGSNARGKRRGDSANVRCDDGPDGCGGDGVLRAGTTQSQQAVERRLRIAVSCGECQGDRIGIVVVVIPAVRA